MDTTQIMYIPEVFPEFHSHSSNKSTAADAVLAAACWWRPCFGQDHAAERELRSSWSRASLACNTRWITFKVTNGMMEFRSLALTIHPYVALLDFKAFIVVRCSHKYVYLDSVCTKLCVCRETRFWMTGSRGDVLHHYTVFHNNALHLLHPLHVFTCKHNASRPVHTLHTFRTTLPFIINATQTVYLHCMNSRALSTKVSRILGAHAVQYTASHVFPFSYRQNANIFPVLCMHIGCFFSECLDGFFGPFSGLQIGEDV